MVHKDNISVAQSLKGIKENHNVLKIRSFERINKEVCLGLPAGVSAEEIRDEVFKYAQKSDKAKTEKLLKSAEGTTVKIGKHEMEVLSNTSDSTLSVDTYFAEKDATCFRDFVFGVAWGFSEGPDEDEVFGNL